MTHAEVASSLELDGAQQMLVSSELRPASTADRFTTIDPTTGEALAEVPAASYR